MLHPLHTQINEIRTRFTQLEDPNLNGLDESFWGGLKQAVTSIPTQFKNGKNISEVKASVEKANKFFSNLERQLSSMAEFFNNLKEQRNEISALQVDAETKKKYTTAIDAIVKTKITIEDSVRDFNDYSTHYKAGQEPSTATTSNTQSNTVSPSVVQPTKPQPQEVPAVQQPTPPSPVDQSTVTPMTPKYQPASKQTPVVDMNPGGKVQPMHPATGKVYNIGGQRQEIDSFLKQRKAMNESVMVDEGATQEGKFHEIFKAMLASKDRMAAAVQGNYNPESVQVILDLALGIILSKGQSAFVDDIKDIPGGLNQYRDAYKKLQNSGKVVDMNPNKAKVVSMNGTNTEPTKSTTMQGDRYGEAVGLANEFLKQHGYPVNRENIKDAAQYILSHNLF